MEYWKGFMNWDLEKGWKCGVCEDYSGLTWGLAHATCRCNTCHAEYRMRGKDDKVVSIPICRMKPEYLEPAKTGYILYKKPVDEFTKEEWDNVMTAKKVL